MAGARITIATVPDSATAELLREVLSDGGIDGVDLRAATGMAYMPRSSSLEYEVRVEAEDELRARQVLKDFEEESGQAATSQAADLISIRREDPSEADPPMRRRKAWVFWVALIAAFVLAAPILFSAANVALHFLRELFAPAS